MGCGISKAVEIDADAEIPSNVLGKGHVDVRKDYELGEVLGQGHFGTVRPARSKKDGKMYACKTLNKHRLKTFGAIDAICTEVQIMKHLNGHENITFLRDTYEDKASIHLIMDLATGGELFEAISQRERYSEADAAATIRTIVSVVAHCHHMGVIHRDLKPDNFLLEDKRPDARLLCIDFGLSTFFKPGQIFEDLVGTAYYLAPEVLDQHYNSEADIWACGVILYILLSGYPPFLGQTEEEIFESIRHEDLDFVTDPWPHISEAAKDCVRRMLERNPEKRATADSILQHPWLKEHGVASDKPLDNAILSRLHNFAGMNIFKKRAMAIIASRIPEQEIYGLKTMFEAIDEDGTGSITVEELQQAMEKKGSMLPKEEVASLLNSIDIERTGTIEYHEFLGATISRAQLEKEEHLREAFAHFDVTKTGTISREDLRTALSQEKGLDVEDDMIERLIADADLDGNGEIDYEEFCAMLMDRAAAMPRSVAKELSAATVAPSRGNLDTYKAIRSNMFVAGSATHKSRSNGSVQS